MIIRQYLNNQMSTTTQVKIKLTLKNVMNTAIKLNFNSGVNHRGRTYFEERETYYES